MFWLWDLEFSYSFSSDFFIDIHLFIIIINKQMFCGCLFNSLFTFFNLRNETPALFQYLYQHLQTSLSPECYAAQKPTPR